MQFPQRLHRHVKADQAALHIIDTRAKSLAIPHGEGALPRCARWENSVIMAHQEDLVCAAAIGSGDMDSHIPHVHGANREPKPLKEFFQIESASVFRLPGSICMGFQVHHMFQNGEKFLPVVCDECFNHFAVAHSLPPKLCCLTAYARLSIITVFATRMPRFLQLFIPSSSARTASRTSPFCG